MVQDIDWDPCQLLLNQQQNEDDITLTDSDKDDLFNLAIHDELETPRLLKPQKMSRLKDCNPAAGKKGGRLPLADIPEIPSLQESCGSLFMTLS